MPKSFHFVVTIVNLWSQENFCKNSIENLYNVFKFFFAHLDKAMIAVKFHTESFFFLGHIDDYIRMTHCAKKVSFPNIIM